MPGYMSIFAQTADGKKIVEEELEKAVSALKRATDSLADINDANDDPSEKIILKSNVLRLIVTLQNSIDNLSKALEPITASAAATSGLGS